MIRSTAVFLVILLASRTPALAETPPVDAVRPLVRAHAHNDYHHERPLLDALACGFCSVEADVFLVDGQLLVGHDRGELRPERSLKRLYLDPLRERVKRGGGRVYRNGPPLLLLIDFKNDGPATYRALAGLLADYADMLTSVTDGKQREGAVTVVLTGSYPARRTIAADSPRYVSLDGRPGDLEDPMPDGKLIPLVSDNWRTHFHWRGRDPLSAEERRKLRSLVEKAHAQGRRIRFWGVPDRESAWEELHAAGVDLINTDDLAGLKHFLWEKQHKKNQ